MNMHQGPPSVLYSRRLQCRAPGHCICD